MKCVCGYEHESGLDENSKWQTHLKGDEEFIMIFGSTFKVSDPARWNDREIQLFACPKCGTLKMEV